MRPLTLLAAGLAISLAVHGSIAAVAPLLLHPDPVADQPKPKSKLRIETEQVAHSNAGAIAPDAPSVNPGQTGGTSLASGAIRQSRATATPPPLTKAAATPAAPQSARLTPPPATTRPLAAQSTPAIVTTPPPVRLAATPNAAQPIAASPAPPLAATQSVRTEATPVKATAAPPARLAATTATPQPLASTALPAPLAAATAPGITPSPALAAPAAPVAALPTAAAPVAALPTAAATLAPSAAQTAPLPAAAATSQASPSLQPNPEALPPSPPEAILTTATLAFSGAPDAPLDAQSLAAIQSFMQPGDASAQTTETRDALQSLLTSVPCARLQAAFNPETGAIDLQGHVPDPGLRAPLLAALQSRVGSGLMVNDAMLILPRPQCGALSGIAATGLPQSTDQFTNRKLIGPDTQARSYNYAKGAQLVLDLAAPDYDAYLYVDYFAADGQVIHLVPNETVPLKRRAAKSTLQVGKSTDGEPFLNITIGPPYGQEIAAAFAASSPLYDGLRPMSEPAEPYLEFLKARVAEARASNPDFKGEWVYFFITTHE